MKPIPNKWRNRGMLGCAGALLTCICVGASVVTSTGGKPTPTVPPVVLDTEVIELVPARLDVVQPTLTPKQVTRTPLATATATDTATDIPSTATEAPTSTPRPTSTLRSATHTLAPTRTLAPAWTATLPPPTQAPLPTQPPTQPPPPPAANCDPSYPDVCIPPPPPDLDCGDIPHRRFRVLAPDPHNFDGNDNDGIGCESG